MRHSLQGVREREHNNRGKNNKSNNNWGCIELPTLQIVGGRVTWGHHSRPKESIG